MTPGKVYLVGAGPGHPELLTVKAAKLLEASDVIIYDRLIQDEVLFMARPSAERIYMGKTVGRHGSRLEEICQLLARKAREGKMVVRLKGGDPFLFGRGGEEAEFLAEEGIPFEVVPGVSSALAAPAGAGIAITHRDLASAVAIVTGHEAAKDKSRLNWDALAGMDTLVFLMAVHNVGQISAELISRGRNPETPAAIIQMAFWHGEKVVSGTLSSIAGEVARAGIMPPATLVVGEVVRLREKLKHSARDLCRRRDSSPQFVPAPAPDQLLRMATAGMGSQVLRFALATSLFDYLEQWRTAPDLARVLGFNTHGLGEILEALVSMGLLECGQEGYRNLELASLYLAENSPQSLKPALLYQSARVASLSNVGSYVLNGREHSGSPVVQELHRDSCECLARYAAAFVLDKLDLSGFSPVLLVGWGGAAYRDGTCKRWPGLVFQTRNPFDKGCPTKPVEAFPDGSLFGGVFFSGLLACCDRNQFRPALERAAAALRDGGMLILHDSFIPSDTPPPPEMVLSALGRHVIEGGSRNWTVARLEAELRSLGLQVLEKHAIPGGTQLIIASACPIRTAASR